jgi:hypothetical protein
MYKIAIIVHLYLLIRLSLLLLLLLIETSINGYIKLNFQFNRLPLVFNSFFNKIDLRLSNKLCISWR